MELLIGAGITLATQVIKWVYSKIANKDLAKAVVLICTFGLTIAGVTAYSLTKDVIGVDTLAQIGTIWAVSIGVYELVLKNLISVLTPKEE